MRIGENGRAGEIRTHDLLHPMQARYQATLQPEQKRKGHKDPPPSAMQVIFLPQTHTIPHVFVDWVHRNILP